MSNAVSGVLKDEPYVWVTNSLKFIEKSKCFGLQIVNEMGRPIRFKKGNVVGRVQWLPDDFHIEPGEPMVNIDNLRHVEVVEG